MKCFILTIKIFQNLGSYAACGFEILLTRKHEPLVYQVIYISYNIIFKYKSQK